MFNNLIESDSHGKNFKRRSSFFLATTAAYALILSAAGVASIYAYDARLESQNSDLEVLNWVPPVTPIPARALRDSQPVRRPNQANAQVDPHITVPERTNPVASVADPTKTPETIGTTAPPFPPVTGPVVIGPRNLDPPGLPSGNQAPCVTCNESGRVIVETTPPPTPTPVKLKTQMMTSFVLTSKAVSIPKPAYPPLAKQTRTEGPVNVQILVDENGKVISAHAVSGNPMLTHAAADAALQARFTPTVLNGQPVKVQGVITYNFVLQ